MRVLYSLSSCHLPLNVPTTLNWSCNTFYSRVKMYKACYTTDAMSSYAGSGVNAISFECQTPLKCILALKTHTKLRPGYRSAKLTWFSKRHLIREVYVITCPQQHREAFLQHLSVSAEASVSCFSSETGCLTTQGPQDKERLLQFGKPVSFGK